MGLFVGILCCGAGGFLSYISKTQKIDIFIIGDELMSDHTGLVQVGKWTFNEISMDDMEMYSYYIKRTDYPVNLWSSSFAYIWALSRSKLRRVLWKFFDDMLVTFVHSYKDSLYLLCLPMGTGSPEKVTRVLYYCMDYCYAYNKHDKSRTLVKMINESQLKFLEECPKFDRYFRLVTLQGIERHFNIKKLVSLAGKDFANIRNRINKFYRENPDVRICRYSDNDFEEIMELGRHWSSIAGKKYANIFDTVYFKEIIKNCEKFNNIVLTFKKRNRIIGMVSGAILPTGEAWGSLIKYEPGITGLSETLIIEFAKEINRIDNRVDIINVGSDLGPGGLREYKLKFRPVRNLKRYQVYIKE